jgi:hypothetical protein
MSARKFLGNATVVAALTALFAVLAAPHKW